MPFLGNTEFSVIWGNGMSWPFKVYINNNNNNNKHILGDDTYNRELLRERQNV